MSKVREFSKGKEVEVEVAGKPQKAKTNSKKKLVEVEKTKKDKDGTFKTEVVAMKEELGNERG